jgi:hypothetical protein
MRLLSVWACSLALAAVLLGCVRAAAPATTARGSTPRSRTETESAAAAFKTEYGDSLGDIKTWNGFGGLIGWAAEVNVVGHQPRSAFRVLLAEAAAHPDTDAVLCVRVVQPAADGTGLSYEYYWNRTGRTHRMVSGSAPMPAFTVERSLLKGNRPALGGDWVGKSVPDLHATEADVRAWATTGAPEFPKVDFVR